MAHFAKLKVSTLLLFLISLHSYGQQQAKHEVSITSSTFTIYGTTNVNAFECNLVQNTPFKPIVVQSRSTDHDINFEGLTMAYPIKDFDCGLEAMSDDLKLTLKSKEFPELYLTINSIHIKQESQEIEKLKVISSVTIKIAGISRTTTIEEGMVINHSEDALTLSGKQQMTMKDFNIEPPTKFFGMVKVNNDLSVGFTIDMLVKTLNKN